MTDQSKLKTKNLGHPVALYQKAETFLKQFVEELPTSSIVLEDRLGEIRREIESSGTYTHSFAELEFGCRLAWRNSTRCIGRRYYPALKVRDARHCDSTDQVFEQILEHVAFAHNSGNLRSAITVFRPRRPGVEDIRIWNAQIIRYAGFKSPRNSEPEADLQAESSTHIAKARRRSSSSFHSLAEVELRDVVGDPLGLEFADLAQSYGWQPKAMGNFEFLPVLLSIGLNDPTVHELPKTDIKVVQLKHSEHDWFADLGLQWYALPMVSNMLLEIGGLEYPAAPFSGWYMSTEIALRNLTDFERYNVLPKVAKGLGLDTRRSRTLWKDKAALVVHEAVLESFEDAGVKIVDHHTASRDFTKFAEQEQRQGRPVYADWAWIVPPTSGSLTEVFHSKWRNEDVTPNFYYQDDPWRHSVVQPKSQQQCPFSGLGFSTKVAPEDSQTETKAPSKCPFH